MKKVVTLILSLLLLFSISIPVFAKQTNNSMSDFIQKRNDKLVEYLKGNPTVEVKTAVDNFIKNNPIKLPNDPKDFLTSL